MNIMKMMSQAKAMQDKMKDMQERLGHVIVEGAAGGGAVKLTMTCKGQCQSVTIDPSVIKADDKEMLEDLVLTAVNDARAKADSYMANETEKMMSELGLPAGALGAGGLPF